MLMSFRNDESVNSGTTHYYEGQRAFVEIEFCARETIPSLQCEKTY